ncbi:hypothetical protein M9458_006654, partial [Cirrhinus mrigala]
VHLYDCGVFWSAHLFHHHNHTEVLHHPGVCAAVWEHHQPYAVVWYHPCLPW